MSATRSQRRVQKDFCFRFGDSILKTYSNPQCLIGVEGLCNMHRRAFPHCKTSICLKTYHWKVEMSILFSLSHIFGEGVNELTGLAYLQKKT